MARVRHSNSGGLEAALRVLKRNLSKAKTVRVGFLEGGTYPDGTSIPLVAAINEFGAPSRGQPPRPFFRNMIAKEKSGWPASIEADLKATNYDAKKTLNRLGTRVKGQLQQSILDLMEPPLKPATIARKGFSKPLIDTSVMLNRVDFEVE